MLHGIHNQHFAYIHQTQQSAISALHIIAKYVPETGMYIHMCTTYKTYALKESVLYEVV